MSLVPPDPTSPIFERTQPLTLLTTKGKPWRLRVRASPTARSGSRGKSSNDSKISLGVTPKSKRQSATRRQNVYHKQTTVSPSPPASYDHYGVKKQTCMKRAWLAFPGARTISLGRARSTKSPLNHSRQQSVFTLCSKPNPPVI